VSASELDVDEVHTHNTHTQKFTSTNPKEAATHQTARFIHHSNTILSKTVESLVEAASKWLACTEVR
jgi:hypothetical protein